jgi:hypothetical protein
MKAFRGMGSVLALLLVACGGGGSSPAPAPPAPAPSGLSYPTPQTYTLNSAIPALTPTVTGNPSGYSVTPALPAGLALNAASGAISGTPTAVQATANFTVTASNTGGSTSAVLSITVRDVAPDISYPRSNYTFSTGAPAGAVTPTVADGAVVSWSIDHPLPAGLNFNTTTGVISGTPSAVSSQASYVVRAENSGGADTFGLDIRVQSGVLLELGHINPVHKLIYDGDRILSQSGQRVVLSDAQSAAQVAAWFSECSPAPCETGGLLAGNTVAVVMGSSWHLFSAVDAAPVSEVPIDASSWNSAVPSTLAADGSYLVVVSRNDGIRVHSRAGALLFSRPGDYRAASLFAAPGEIRVGNGPAGAQVIETISVPSGSSSVSAAFAGTFRSWFLDGERFTTASGNTARVYSRAAMQLDIGVLPTAEGLAGNGDWFWTKPQTGGTVRLYAVGSAGTPTVTYELGTLGEVIGSAHTLALIASGTPAIGIVDLSGSAPVRTDYVSPLAYVRQYAAISASEWAFAAGDGVVMGELGAGLPQFYTRGRAVSIAGSGSRVAVATAAGEIVYFNATTQALEGTIGWPSSQLSLSADGSRLGASASTEGDQFLPDRTLRIYSLPSDTILQEWPYSFTGGQPWSSDFSLSASGNLVGQTLVLFNGFNWPGTQRVVRLDGTVTWSQSVTLNDPHMRVHLSSDGSRIAVADRACASDTGTNIFEGSTLVGAAAGCPVGWIDDARLLVNRYVPPGANYSGAQIVDATGLILATPALVEVREIQALGGNEIYSPERNQIFDVATGNPVWSSPTPTGDSIHAGAVAGNNVYFTSDDRQATVRVEPR